MKSCSSCSIRAQISLRDSVDHLSLNTNLTVKLFFLAPGPVVLEGLFKTDCWVTLLEVLEFPYLVTIQGEADIAGPGPHCEKP